MGVFGPNGLSSRNISYTGTAITNSLNPGDHTTIDRLVADAHSYEFVLHPGDFAYAGLLFLNGVVVLVLSLMFIQMLGLRRRRSATSMAPWLREPLYTRA